MQTIRQFYWRAVMRVSVYMLGESAYWHDIAVQRLATLRGQP